MQARPWRSPITGKIHSHILYSAEELPRKELQHYYALMAIIVVVNPLFITLVFFFFFIVSAFLNLLVLSILFSGAGLSRYLDVRPKDPKTLCFLSDLEKKDINRTDKLRSRAE